VRVYLDHNATTPVRAEARLRPDRRRCIM